MEIAQGLIITAGLVLGLLAFLLGRADRLSSGYGITWLLVGLLLLILGVAGPIVAAWLPGTPQSSLAFLIMAGLLTLPVLLGLLLFEAVTLTRLKERLLHMAQEVALLRSALENRTPDRKDTGADDGVRST